MVNGLLAGAAGGAAVSIVIQAIDKFSGTFKNVNKSMAASGAAMTALGVAGLAISKSFIDVASSFESAFAGVKKTVDLTAEEFDNLRISFKDLSKEIPVTFQELSSIGEIAGQLGVEGVANLEKFTKTIADISVSTNLTAENAATSFARIANIMKEPIENVDRMGAVVVDLGNNFATTETEIATFANRIAGAGAIAGLSVDQIFAIGASFSSVGVQAEAGGTAVQKVLINMNTAVIEGGDKLKTFAETAGLSSEEFAKAWKEDAGRAFSAFIIGLGKQGDKAISTLDELELKDQRLVRAFLSLANSGDLVTDTFQTANKAWKENTALVEEAEKRYETTESQVKILKNKFESLKDQMGQTLIPTFIKLVDVLGKVIGWMEQHPKLTSFAVAAVAIGSALAVIVGPILILVAMLPALIAGFGTLSAVTLPITGTILAIAAAVVAVVAGIVLLVKWLKKLKGERVESDKEEFNRLNNLTNSIDLKPVALKRNEDIIHLSESNRSGITVNIDKVQGVDADEITELMAKRLSLEIRR